MKPFYVRTPRGVRIAIDTFLGYGHLENWDQINYFQKIEKKGKRNTLMFLLLDKGERQFDALPCDHCEFKEWFYDPEK